MKIFLLLIYSLAPFFLFSQITISGKIVTEEGHVVYGANIEKSGNKEITTSDREGEFTLTINGDLPQEISITHSCTKERKLLIVSQEGLRITLEVTIPNYKMYTVRADYKPITRTEIVPATYTTVEEMVLVKSCGPKLQSLKNEKQSEEAEKPIPAEYRLETRKVLLTPAYEREVVVPFTCGGARTKQVLVPLE